MIKYNEIDFNKDINALALQILKSEIKLKGIYGIPRGGIPVATALSVKLQLPLVSKNLAHHDPTFLIVDDLIDSGKTISEWIDHPVATLHCKPHSPKPNFFVEQLSNDWIHYFWEDNDSDDSGEDIVVRLLELIGEDPTRQGLLETPKRFIKAWQFLTKGYKQNPEKIIKCFDSETYDQIVLLKDIEIYSMCEHHCLPFWGKAHIAYIPRDKVIGVSKLARLIDIYARRLQIQERLGEQVTTALMKYLNPQGAACIIEAAHLCMRMRGVQKQNSVMTTSSLKGVFFDDAKAREELMRLIG